MKYQIITIYIALCSFLGIYGILFAPFNPELNVKTFSTYFSVTLFLFLSVATIWLAITNRNKIIVKFNRPFNFYFFTFAGIPALLAFVALLNHGAWSRAIPSMYTFATTEPEITSSEITNKRLWGRNDLREEIFISGYHEGFPVSKSYYQSVNIGQSVKIAIRRSKLGTHLEFLQP